VNNILELLREIFVLMRSGQLPQLGLWTYILLAALVAIEGPVATLLGAAGASAGLMRPWLVFAAAAAGNLTADCLWYSLGYMGRIEWFLRFGRRMGLSRDHLERLQHNMRKHAAKILFFAKLSLSMVIPSLVAAGLVKAPWRRWFPFVFTAEMIWTGSLVLVGYYATEAIKRVEQGLEYLVLVASSLFIILMIWLARRILRGDGDQDTDPIPAGEQRS
jgi:membrane protein DedA with SNARE-associated domain